MTRWIDIFLLRLRSLFRRDTVDRELDRELRFHLDSRSRELIADGLEPGQARTAALREFGSTASIAEQCRDTRRVNFVGNLLQDLRYAVRVLIAQPILLLTACTSIALGVGANLAIFGLANDLLLAAPTARRADQLVHIRTGHGSHAPYTAWRHFAGSGALAGVAGYQLEVDVNWRGGDTSRTVTALAVTENFFDVLGVPVVVGRPFDGREAALGRDPQLAVVSDAFWRSRLGGDARIIGQSILLNGSPYIVLGVLAPNLRSLPGYGIVPDVYLSINRSLMPGLDAPRASNVQLIGRLKDGQSPAQAQAALSTIAASLAHTAAGRDASIIKSVANAGSVEQVREFKEVGAFFAVLLFVTGLVLAIACANVAGLLLARGTARRREIALRLAVGASRGRLVQQLLTEGFLLSLVGTAAGLVITAGLDKIVSQISLPLPFPLEFHVSFDGRMMLFATALVIVSTLLCALTPALQATRPALAPALKLELPVYGHRRLTLRGWLVVAQVAVSVLLLVTTALFVRNLTMAHTLSPGFDTDRTLVAAVSFVEGRQGTGAAPAVSALIDRIRGLPGVETAAFASGIPLTMRFGGETGTEVRFDGRGHQERVDFFKNDVGPDYFKTMGLQIVQGRDFTGSDRIGGERKVIVNQEFVRRYFKTENPLGRRIFIDYGGGEVSWTIIGVASDSKYRSIGEPRSAAVYGALLQHTAASRFVHLLVRTHQAHDAMIRLVRGEIGRFDPSAAVTVEPMSEALTFAFLPSRLGAALIGALGILGAVLAMVGLYGIVSFAVARRTSEIGVRMALGASRGRVLALVLQDGAVLVGAGLMAGLAFAFVATGPLRAFLVADLDTTDPLSFAATVLLLLGTSMLASWGPAWRAAKIHPAVTLRAE